MEINYRSKEESNRMQQEAFLHLSPAERFYTFLALSERLSSFPVAEPGTDRWSENFQIVIQNNGKQLEGQY